MQTKTPENLTLYAIMARFGPDVGGEVKGKGRAYKANKTPGVALLERGGRVRSRSVANVTGKTLKKVLTEGIDCSAHLMTSH